MHCLECSQSVARLDNVHLLQCCGLTLQEYALRHGLLLDVIVAQDLINQQESDAAYQPRGFVTREAKIVFAALQAAGKVKYNGSFCYVAGEVRQLDQLLWLKERLVPFSFQFRQEYILNDTTHRVVALNHLKARRSNVPVEGKLEAADWNDDDWLLFSTVLLAANSAFYGGYIFLTLASEVLTKRLQALFDQHFNIHFHMLPWQRGQYMLRTLKRDDAMALLNILQSCIEDIPGVAERYYLPQPRAQVAKQLTFDAAHFITDHPGKCTNLHGGRYDLIVKVYDRIDPQTGFVVDYGYLKSVMKHEVMEVLDHQHLNLADPSLAWRSSTEHISLFIWEKLIHYLPNLCELQIYETAQSCCCFTGPSLDELQQNGGRIKPGYFQDQALGRSQQRRNLLQESAHPTLHAVRGR